MIFFRKILVIILTAVFCFGTTGQIAKAQQITGVQRQALIAQVQQQITQLQSQLAQALAQQQGTDKWCYTFNNNLGFANSGTKEVVGLHMALQQQGISYNPDGAKTYSTGTVQAVIQFQKKYGISPARGYVGSLTRTKLNTLYGCENSGAASSDSPEENESGATPLTGSLDLSQNTSYADQSFTAPQSKFKFADFSLTNNTTEPINLKNIEVDLATDSNLYITNLYVSNLYVTYGNDKTPVLSSVAHNNYWTINSQLPAGQTIDLSVYGDVNSSISLGSTVSASVLVSGVSAVSATNVYTNSNSVLAGQNITSALSSLTVDQDSSTPSERIVGAGQRVVAGQFQFTAANDSYTVSELKFVVPISNAGALISDAVLTDTATQTQLSPKPAPIIYDGRDYVLDFNATIPVAGNSSESLTLYYDLNPSVDSTSADISIAPILVYAKAKNSEGAPMDGVAENYTNLFAANNNIIMPPDGVTVNGLYVFKSTPVFTADSSNLNASNNSDANIYTFSVTASPNGDVSLKQLTFLVTITDPNSSNPILDNFTFLKGSTDYTSNTFIGNVMTNNYIGLASDGSVGTGATNMVVVTFKEEEKIPAGQTQTYALRAHTNRFTSSAALGSDSISTYMPSDTNKLDGGNHLAWIMKEVYYGLAQSSTDISVIKDNSLWSDRSEIFPDRHDDFNGNYTDDWYNGYGVLNLPLPAQTVTAQ